MREAQDAAALRPFVYGERFGKCSESSDLAKCRVRFERTHQHAAAKGGSLRRGDDIFKESEIETDWTPRRTTSMQEAFGTMLGVVASDLDRILVAVGRHRDARRPERASDARGPWLPVVFSGVDHDPRALLSHAYDTLETRAGRFPSSREELPPVSADE
jgi:hypothetical protein